MNNEQSPIRHTHPWVGGGPCLVNAVARRLSGGDSWVGGSPCLVNVVARRLSDGGDSWVGGGPCLVTNKGWLKLNGV